jgi:predicted dehydrogenase
MLRVGIVGCGKIADVHVGQIQKIRGCEIVGVCDTEPLMARQLSERFGIKRHYDCITELLGEARPDVVHITTPPQNHFPLAMLCLNFGCHVYVEKPFALCEKDTHSLIALANGSGLKVTAGHDDQFGLAARRMRAMIQEGFLGGPPVHMESYYGYELGESAYARALLADRRHWVRRLPGKLLHNVISHGVARIAEYIQSESPQVIAFGFISPHLKKMGETEIIDELRVIICDDVQTTAYFTFSSQMRPSVHQFRIYGPENGLLLDHDQEAIFKLKGRRYQSYIEQFAGPAGIACQSMGNTLGNVRRFLAHDLHMKAGMKHLINSFYRSIIEDLPVPIPYREIEMTARIMDAIFVQINAKETARMPAEAGNSQTEPLRNVV